MKRFIIAFILMLPACYSAAQKYYEINLENDSHQQAGISLDYDGIKLVNKVTDYDYSVTVEVELEAEPGSDPGEKGTKERLFTLADCNIDSLLHEVRVARDEKTVAATIRKLKRIARAATHTKGCIEQAIDSALVMTTELRKFHFGLKKNQKIHITITRKGRAEPWKVTLETPKALGYLSHFGFTFVPNGNRNTDRYFARETADGEYTITAMNENGEPFWKDLSLTANYIIPIGRVLDERIQWGINGGFGLNGNASFSVMAGPALLFSDFLSLSINGGLYNRHKLKGEYSPGQVLNEALSSDQLTELGLRPALMISLGFRLSKEQMQAPVEEKGKD